MKVIPIALANHIASEVTTVSHLWKLTRRDGVVMGFTDADVDIVLDGLRYEASGGFTASAITSSGDLAVDNLEVQGLLPPDLKPVGVLNSPTITAQALEAGVFDGAEIELYRCNRERPQDGLEKVRKGYLGQTVTTRSGFHAELRGLMQILAQDAGDIYTPGCIANLGDAKCRVDLGPLTVSGTVTRIQDNYQFGDDARLEAAGYFTGGLLTWVTGKNAGSSFEVRDYDDSVFTTFQGTVYDIEIGDTYKVYQGCDKRITTCQGKFKNAVNFRGFPYTIGMDRFQSGE